MSTTPFDQSLAQAFLIPCSSAIDLKNWIYTYLDLDIPMGHVDPDSTSSPMEALYEAYAAYRDDKCFEIPGFIWVSSRDSCKTLAGSILNVLLMVHFKAQIGHLAATKGQAGRCITYVNRMITKIKPFLEYHKRQVTAESKTHIGITNEDGSESFVEIIVANLAGGNSFHGPVATYDELDCLSKQGMIGYEESKMMATRYKNRGPLRLKYSTRKFAFGIFEKEIQNASQSKERILRWNIIDMTERCDESIHRPDLPKVIRYVPSTLPLMNLSLEELNNLSVKEQGNYQPIEAFAGCASCLLLSVCHTRLANRDKSATGVLYKPVWLTRQYFNEIEIDMAEAQLMCWKPSLSGLVYSRFDMTHTTGNIYTLAKAYEVFTGESAPQDLTLRQLTDAMVMKGIQFKAGVDFGSTHCFAITVHALIPNGEWWLIDTYAVPGMEFEDMIALAEEVRDKYRMTKWYPDNSAPMFIKAFRKRRMPCVDFKKDVPGGIESVRGQIINAKALRRLKVLLHERNEFAIKGFQMHHFKIDAQGNPTKEPDDEEFADVMDSIRYFAQNHFGVKGKAVSPSMPQDFDAPRASNPDQQRVYNDFLSQKIRELAQEGVGAQGKSPTGGIVWDFSGSDDPTES